MGELIKKLREEKGLKANIVSNMKSLDVYKFAFISSFQIDRRG